MSVHVVCRRLGVALCLAAAVACGAPSTTTPVGPDPGSEAMFAPDAEGVTASARKALPEDVQAALLDVLQLEYEARATYVSVMGLFGEVRPFVNVTPAEDQHVAKLVKLFTSRGLDAPPPENLPISAFDDLVAACVDAAARESALGQSYQAFDKADCPRDVWRVVTHLGDASLDRHLPAFQKCAGRE